MDKEYKGCVSWKNQVGKNNSEVVQKMVTHSTATCQ